MQTLKPLEEFKISTEKSEHLSLPLPSEALAYKELELTDSMDMGIHRLHFFKIIHEKFLHSGSALAHVHRFYASWEMKQGRKTHYLIH
jgi:flavin reductase (DIM6/NTAB) family NADH-FMN oxidoreductase RutF